MPVVQRQEPDRVAVAGGRPESTADWNICYGTVHFAMPLVALVWLFRKNPERYVLWRNTLGFMLVIGLLGFWLYPLMPPRLLPHHYGFVDTPVKFFGFGKPAKGNSIEEYGNIYAAMPSLHIGWSSWTAFALFPMVRRRWARALVVAYPCATTFATVMTGNHYLLDAAGGLAALGIGYAIARPLTLVMARRGWTFSAARAPRSGRLQPAALEADPA